jgi:hypothetical protein
LLGGRTVEKTVSVLLGIKERAEEVLHFMCGWTNRGEDHVFDRKTQRSCRKKKKTTLVDFEGSFFFFFFWFEKRKEILGEQWSGENSFCRI